MTYAIVGRLYSAISRSRCLLTVHVVRLTPRLYFQSDVAVIIVRYIMLVVWMNQCSHYQRRRKVDIHSGVSLHISQHFIRNHQSLSADIRRGKGVFCIVRQGHGNPREGWALVAIGIPASDNNLAESPWYGIWNRRAVILCYSKGCLNRCHAGKGDFSRNQLPQTNPKTVHVSVGRVGLVSNHFWSHAVIAIRKTKAVNLVRTLS